MAEMFPDQRDHLFGREPAIRFLSDRAGRPGLTSVVARPLMGKTWALLEVARRQVEEGHCLVGYHESKGSESSHLLYAVANLYTGWLSDSGMREQAVSLWQRHKADLVPRIGQLAGLLFEKLGGKQLAPEGVAGVVRATFDGLANAQKDLLTGGLKMDPLSYDEALSITDLVAKVSGRRVILILDAWEKSHSMRSEFTTLETFLKHQRDWPDTHVFLGIRSPDVQSAGASAEAFQYAGVLGLTSASALRYDLTPLDLSATDERDRIVGYLHDQVPATRQLHAAELLKLIDGFPGVVSRWVSDVNREAMRTVDDLKREALTAQTLRYLEFDQLLNGLPDAHRTFAARLAFLPRLDADRWPTFRPSVLGDASEAIVDDLIDAHVLENESYPTYGHDTRHAAARNWFGERQINLSRRVAEGLVEKIASQISGADSTSVLFVGALAASAPFLHQVSLSPTTHCLVNAACSAFEETDAIFDPAFDDALASAAKQNASFVPLLVICLIARGIAKVLRGDSDGGVADFTSVIAYKNAAAGQVAQAYVNRGITKAQIGDKAGAIADYTSAIELPDAPSDQVASAFNNRGVVKDALGDDDGALADYEAAIELPNVSADGLAQAIYNRGAKKAQRAEVEGAIADFTTVIELPNASVTQVAQALYNRAVARGERGDADRAIADYTAVVTLADAPANAVAQSLYNRGVMNALRGEVEHAIEDFTAVIELPGAPDVQVAKALNNRGVLEGQRGDVDASMRDHTAVIAMPHAPPEQVARALYNRAAAKSEHDDIDGAIADYTAVIELPDAPAGEVAQALYNRGVMVGRRGDRAAAIADFSKALALPLGASVQVAKTRYNRGVMRGESGDSDGAIADYTAVIELRDAPAEQVAKSLYNRGVMKGQRADRDGALADYTAVVELPGAPDEIVKLAQIELADRVQDA